MQLQTAIISRRSIRKFKNTPIGEDVIRRMLEAAQAAPSGGNAQNHLFGIVTDAALKRELAETAGGQMWIADASVVIACCARLDSNFRELPKDDFANTVNKLRWGEPFWEYFTNYSDWNRAASLLANAAPLIPAEHIALTAVENGLSSCFVGWLDVDRASNALNLPKDIRCLFLLPVGYADEQPQPKELKSLDEISFRDAYRTAQ